MKFIYYNPNPKNKLVGDCVIRALSISLNKDWKTTYRELCQLGEQMFDMPSSNEVWGTYLKNYGYRRYTIPNTCPNCYSVYSFCIDHPIGKYILATGSHVITVIDGYYYDTWDSGMEIPIYYWKKEIKSL